MRTVSFASQNEREHLISDANILGEILIEERNLIEGNFLIFGASSEITKTNLPAIEDDYLIDLDYRLSKIELGL